MRVKVLGKVPERLDGNDRAGECGGFGNCRLEETPQGIPTLSGQKLCQGGVVGVTARARAAGLGRLRK